MSPAVVLSLRRFRPPQARFRPLLTPSPRRGKMVDDEAPKTRGLKHLKVRAKRWALVAERDMKVTADNMHLLKSMVRIQSGGKGELPPPRATAAPPPPP